MVGLCDVLADSVVLTLPYGMARMGDQSFPCQSDPFTDNVQLLYILGTRLIILIFICIGGDGGVGGTEISK